MMTFGNNKPKSGNSKPEIKNNKPKRVEEIKKRNDLLTYTGVAIVSFLMGTILTLSLKNSMIFWRLS